MAQGRDGGRVGVQARSRFHPFRRSLSFLRILHPSWGYKYQTSKFEQTGVPFAGREYSLYATETRVNPFTPKSDLIDFTLSNARRCYSSKGDPLGVKGLKNYLL